MNKRITAAVEQIQEFEAIQQAAPKDLLLMGDMSMAIAHYVFQQLEDKKMSQKDLAVAMEKTEAEVSKWLGGMHNLTLRSIAKLQVALGEAVIVVPHKNHHEAHAELPALQNVVRFQTAVKRITLRKHPVSYNQVTFAKAMPNRIEQVA